MIPEQLRERLLEALRVDEEFAFVREEPEYKKLDELYGLDKNTIENKH